MSIVETPGETRVVLSSVSWSTFEALLAETDHRNTRFTYDRGRLEIMSPSGTHERFAGLLGRMVEAMTEEWGIPIRTVRSTTLRDEMKDRGVEPDECYYVANEASMRDKDEIDLAIDPPPDLAVEVDISRSSLDKLAIYADLQVREVWIYNGRKLQVYELQSDGAYRELPRSPSLPALPLEGVHRFLQQRKETDETTWIRSFRAWLRTLPV